MVIANCTNIHVTTDKNVLFTTDKNVLFIEIYSMQGCPEIEPCIYIIYCWNVHPDVLIVMVVELVCNAYA